MNTRCYKVLIAEDRNEFGEDAIKLFTEKGFESNFCEKDGNELIKAYKELKPDVVLADMFMSGTDAVGVMKRLRSETGGLPVFVVISNTDSPVLEKEALSAGAVYYVIKPFSTSDLAERISELILCLDGNDRSTGGEIFSFDRELEITITEILHQIGVPAHIKGYHYLRDSIMLSVTRPEIINAVTKELYPTVAKKYSTTPSRVERAIRHAIEVAWDRGDVDVLNSYFGYTIHTGRGKPTNSEFIAMISDRLRLHNLRSA